VDVVLVQMGVREEDRRSERSNPFSIGDIKIAQEISRGSGWTLLPDSGSGLVAQLPDRSAR